MVFHESPHVYVGHVHLKVQDLQRSLAFYQDILGLTVLEQSDHTALLSADGKTELISLTQPSPIFPKQNRTSGLYHFALLLPERKDLAAVIRHLISTGYPLQGASDHLVSEALYLADPDGNGIEIYRDRTSEGWEWENGEVVMATNAMDVEGVLSEWDGSHWEGLPAGTIMGHIHLHVSEFAKTKEFYIKGLGFQTVCTYGGQALFISTGGYHHHIGLNTWNGIGAPAPSEAHAGMESFTLVYPNEEERQAAVNRLKTLGIDIAKANGQYIVKDPSGTKMIF
ncbi:VOC family protein [Cytobacillus gottheilii]|uniref:VOC family protein n=1 Tax=Cytobacillus gottheilii TaxID=859144 RepID=UPI0009BC1828|nr:VOC family protein [Cytobacillus gottheilii]